MECAREDFICSINTVVSKFSDTSIVMISIKISLISMSWCTLFIVLDFAETSYTIGENDISIPICVRLVSGVNSVINGSIKTSSPVAKGKT